MIEANIFEMVPVKVASAAEGTIFISDKKIEIIDVKGGTSAKMHLTEPTYFRPIKGVFLTDEEYKRLLKNE